MDLRRFANLKSLEGPILVTGHTGFKGTWLTMLLEEIGVEVYGLSLPPVEDSMYLRLNRTGRIPEVFMDINDRTKIVDYISELKPSVICHMAAQPLVSHSYIKPVETFMTNVMGTAHLLEAAFQAETVKVFAVVTTDKVYENLETGQRFQELSPLGGKDPYSASKVGTEQVINAWRQIRKLNSGPSILSLRAGNVIGGGDYAANRLLPDLVRGLLYGARVRIRNPKSSRPWQHVLDPLLGYLLAIEKALIDNQDETYNFGPTETSLRVEEVIEIARDFLPKDIIEIVHNSSQEFIIESLKLDLDSSKSLELLQWAPKWTQQEAIIRTLEWWSSNNCTDQEAKSRIEIMQVIQDIGAGHNE